MNIDLTTAVDADNPLVLRAQQMPDRYVAMGHIGTHLDTYYKTPIPPEYAHCRGILFDVRGREEVTEDDFPIEQVQAGDFVLFRTGWMECHSYGAADYFVAHPQLAQSLIHALAEKHIRFIGVDAPGIRRGEEHTPADRFCEEHGVYVIENLSHLEQLPTKRCSVLVQWQEDSRLTGLPCRVTASL